MADRSHKVVVAFASFPYTVPDRVRKKDARRGETVVINDEDYELGKRLGAFVDSPDELVRHGTLPSLSPEASEGDVAHWMRSAGLSDIQAVLADSPGLDMVAAMAAGETSRGSEARDEVFEALDAHLESESQEEEPEPEPESQEEEPEPEPEAEPEAKPTRSASRRRKS